MTFDPLAPTDSRMIRAPIANAVIASIVVAEILGGMMLLLQLQH
ncbi:MAG: hypothetical protein U1E25_15020 [Methylocystis sp.]